MSNDTTQHTPADVREPTDAQINVWSIIRSALSRAWALSRPWAVADRPQVTSDVVARLDAIAADCEREVLALLRTPRGEGERVKEPTQAQIDDACMWYRHDFGLLSESERDSVRFEARQWFRAWGKALSNGDDHAALRSDAQGEENGGEFCDLCGEMFDPSELGTVIGPLGEDDGVPRWYRCPRCARAYDAGYQQGQRDPRGYETADPTAPRSEAQEEDTIPVSALRSEIALLRKHRLLPYLAWARLCALAGGEPVGEDSPAARRGEGGGDG